MLKFLLTCEHGGNSIPVDYKSYFQGHQDVLNTHRGYDKGALELFHDLKDMADVSYYSQTSRLLVELNRSLHHPNLFSEFTKPIGDNEKKEILDKFYFPYRNEVEQAVHDLIVSGNTVLHIAIHSFTPIMNGEVRNADIGLLYDPKRKPEQGFCRNWRLKLLDHDPNLLVRYNYPYKGIADGFPTYMRKKYKEKEYLGIELEVNQKYPEGNKKQWLALKNTVKESLTDNLQVFRIDKTQPEKPA